MEEKWSVRSPDPNQIANLTAALNCHRVVAAVLINRGFGTPDDAARFLHPSLAYIRSPFLMKDMDRAVSRILRALQRREKVLIFGDYDVDGMTATALLLDFLTYLGMDVDYYIPDRLTEGYGLSPESVEQEAICRDIALIITAQSIWAYDTASGRLLWSDQHARRNLQPTLQIGLDGLYLSRDGSRMLKQSFFDNYPCQAVY